MREVIVPALVIILVIILLTILCDMISLFDSKSKTRIRKGLSGYGKILYYIEYKNIIVWNLLSLHNSKEDAEDELERIKKNQLEMRR